MLAEGRNVWSEIPESRFNHKALYHPDSEKLGTVRLPFLDLNFSGEERGSRDMARLTRNPRRRMSKGRISSSMMSGSSTRHSSITRQRQLRYGPSEQFQDGWPG
jgi:hypothetical protein